MLYSPSVAVPELSVLGQARGERGGRRPPQIHMVNSAPHDTAVHALTEHWTGARRLSSSLGLVLAMLPTPSWPCLLLPHAYALPSAVTTTVCDLPQAPSTTLMPASALTSVGADLLSTSPRPSWPVSFLPQVNTRPSVAITMHMDVALPPHTFANADALERGDPRRLDDVRVLVLVVGLAAADHLPVGHAAEENLALFGAIVRHRLSSVYEGVGEVWCVGGRGSSSDHQSLFSNVVVIQHPRVWTTTHGRKFGPRMAVPNELKLKLSHTSSKETTQQLEGSSDRTSAEVPASCPRSYPVQTP